jgi:hypothetical protein
MAQITIDIPDDLAQRLAPFQSQFSDLFTRLIATTLLGQTTPDRFSKGEASASGGSLLEATPMTPNANSMVTSVTYQEILDFLVARPTSAQIINFKVSEASQSRLQTLLQKNNEIVLTAAETAEIDLYQQLDTLIGFLKIKAYATLQTTPQN